MQYKTLFYRKLTDRVMSIVCVLVLAISLGIMLWILWTVFSHGLSAISWSFLTEPSKPYGIANAGIGNALLGTLLITTVSTILTLPPAMAAGIYLAEFGKNSIVADWIRFSANVMMGIPSIVVGLFVYAIWVIPTGHFSGFAGSVALSIIMFPVIVRTTEDMLLMVPDTQREAALALGITRRRATLDVIFRSARSGLATGVLMAFARVSGETAPLLFTALWSDSWPTDFFTSPTANIPVLITEYTTNSPFEQMHAAGWGAAMIIMALMLLINIGVKFITAKKY